jgi:hypothetical protein
MLYYLNENKNELMNYEKRIYVVLNVANILIYLKSKFSENQKELVK